MPAAEWFRYELAEKKFKEAIEEAILGFNPQDPHVASAKVRQPVWCSSGVGLLNDIIWYHNTASTEVRQPVRCSSGVGLLNGIIWYHNAASAKVRQPVEEG